MTEHTHSSQKEDNPVNRKKTIIISLVILLAAAAVTAVIFSTEPTAKRGGATKETAMLVDVVQVTRGNYRPTIITTGTVVPAKDVFLSPRVNGEIVSRSDNFTPGGYAKKGEVLVKIDPADYVNALQLRQSELHQAQADLEIEMGRQNVAMKDYQLVEEELAGENKALVLREPQLNAARSQVEAAEAAVNQAELDLQRTAVKAPFDAHIITRNVNVGSQVSPGENLGRLVGMDMYWVEITVPLSKLPWLSFPESEQEMGALVKIRNRTAWPESYYRTGYLYKLVGALENQTRLARAIVAVEDPLARQTSSKQKQPLIIGAFMEASIEGDEITDVIRLNRDYIRKDETVWVMIDNKLQIRDLEIIFQDAKYAYISSGLKENEAVVTTNLSTITEGVSLRVESENNEAPADTSDNIQNENSGGMQ
ncbi:efflux RND transporter periplasmic adaptor subunit [Draconibacterium halophilum]|uniref:Efflux RND transporter periplasmic adaptor subunit n=1 Tax=Draconibacterium halophilum TaxID=2706887 RepID=A0A6C0RCK0_9BACT|nr:efflux RND transporter periplasmic adaptor subunit [Draconibacterium halophilum]QIA08060.1 efflux RND transporter periplasmic adaptor subunit [Draconibacterium halophilum]